jgi:hypothetical protein
MEQRPRLLRHPPQLNLPADSHPGGRHAQHRKHHDPVGQASLGDKQRRDHHEPRTVYHPADQRADGPLGPGDGNFDVVPVDALAGRDPGGLHKMPRSIPGLAELEHEPAKLVDGAAVLRVQSKRPLEMRPRRGWVSKGPAHLAGHVVDRGLVRSQLTRG